MSSSPIIISTSVDLGGIQKYNEASAAVSTSNARMADSFKQATEASAGLESAERRVESINERTAAQFNETAAAGTEAGYSMREARGSARLLAEELGVSLNRELASSISRSEILGPILAKAFSVIAVLGFAEVLAGIPDAIEKIIGKLTGWDEEAKKAYEEMVRGNLEVMAQNRELEAQEARTAAVGLEGSRKYAAELKNTQNELRASAADSNGLLQAVARMNAEMQKIKPPSEATAGWQVLVEAVGRNVFEVQWLVNWLDGANSKYKELSASAKLFNDQVTRAQEEQKRMRVEEDKVKAEAAADATRQNIADQESRVEHARSAAEAIESYDRSVYEQRYRLGEISIAQETELLKQSEDRQFAAAEATYRKLRSLAVAKGATGQDVTPELEKMDTEQEKLQAEHYEKLNALDTTYREQTKRNALADAEAQIEANEKIQESNLKLAETKEKFDFGHADSQAELEAAAIPYIQTTTQLYVAQIEALRRRQEELAKDPTPENARKIAELTAQEIVLANQSAQAIVGIENEKEEKIKGIRARDLENTVSTLNAELDVSSGHYQEGVSELQKSLSEKRISLSAYVTQAEELAGREYSAELATLEKETDAVRQAAAQKIITEQQASKQLEDIWKRETQIFNEEQKRREEVEKQAVQKEAEDIKRATDQIARDFTQAFNQIITGHEKVGQAAAKARAGTGSVHHRSGHQESRQHLRYGLASNARCP